MLNINEIGINAMIHALIPALESTKERGLVPREVLADSLYGSDESRQATRELGVEVNSPVMGAPKDETLSLADFPQTDKGMIAACPQGHVPVKIKRGKNNAISVGFASEHCGVCPHQKRCPVKPGKKRHYLGCQRAFPESRVSAQEYFWPGG